jgi:hypothetical protein
MAEIKYSINKNESITRWWTSDVKITPFESPNEIFDAPVNSGEGYVQIIYPVRKEFIKHHNLKEIERFDKDYKHIYFPFENNRVDFSTFIHTPHKMEVFAKTSIEVEEKKNYKFMLYTCGAVKIWVDKEEKMSFSPFTRNIASSKELDLFLDKGKHTIEVYAEELAERDVFFYFELRSLNSEEIKGILPFEGEMETLKNLENWLTSCYFEKDVYTEGEVVLNFDDLLFANDLDILIGVDLKDSPKLFDKEVKEFKIQKNDRKLLLGNVYNFGAGVYKLKIGAKIANQIIYRTLVVAIRPSLEIERNPKKTLEERKIQAANFICDHGTDSINKALLLIEKEKCISQETEQCILNSLNKISKKEDCADFVFSPMLILITKYKKYLSKELYTKIYNNIINFRYWIDEPGSDVMWYFSENHALLFHTAQYLAGQMFKDDVFIVSNRKGIEQNKIGKKRLLDWFDEFFKYGFAEWNSATYIPIDLIGFFTLYELSKDPEIKQLAKKALDNVFKLIAYSSYNGILSTSYGRCYEKTLKSREQVETSFISWIAFKEGYIGRRTQAVPLFCLSDYEPNIDLGLYTPSNKKAIEFKQGQGINKVNIYSYKTEDYLISSVQAFNPYKHGHQQHIMNITLSSECEQFYINNPGERAFSGENRPSYWAGNGTNPYVFQNKNTLLMTYKIEEIELVHAIHAYVLFDNYDKCIEDANYLFLRKNDSYLAVWFSNAYKRTTKGANKNKEIIANGLKQAVVLKCGSKKEYSSFDNFINLFKSSEIIYDRNKNYLQFNNWDAPVIAIQDTESLLENKKQIFDFPYELEIKNYKKD